MNFFNLKLSRLSFVFVFSTLLFIVVNGINIEKISNWFILGESIDYAGLLAYLIFGLCFFIAFFMLFSHRYILKTIAIFVSVFSISASYFISKYNIALDKTMLRNLINTDMGESSAFLSLQMLWYVPLMFVFIILILQIKITFRPVLTHTIETIVAFVLVISFGMGLVYVEYKSIVRAGNQSKKYIVYQLTPSNAIVAAISIAEAKVKETYKKYKSPVKITGSVTKTENLIVVLAIGETSRQKNFSLYGYDKNTNPILSKIDGLHLLDGRARLASTIYALPEILEKQGIKLATITSKLGIKTECLVNYTLYENCEAVGEIKVHNCNHNGSCYDEDVVPLLKKSLKNYKAKQQLTVLHLGGGSHGPNYKGRHPKEFQQFNPQCLDADIVNKCTKAQLYNSYDNTILYVDYVLGEIIETLESSKLPYVLIYLSDHGESLLENDNIFHGVPPGMTIPEEQAKVPLLVKSSIPINITKTQNIKQPYVFDTILSLLNIKSDILNQKNVFIEKASQ